LKQSLNESLKTAAILALKRAFSRSKKAKAIKDKAVMPNMKGLRGGKVVKCGYCHSPVPYYKAEIDHKDPICPVEISLLSMSLDMVFRRIFCDDSNLICTCKECHKKKSDQERKERVKWRKKKKYLVCRLKGGVILKVFGIVDLKSNVLYNWDILSVWHDRKSADADMKKRNKRRDT